MKDLMKDSDWAEVERLQTHLLARFHYLQNQRADLDDDIGDEIRAYNNVDQEIANMPDNFH